MTKEEIKLELLNNHLKIEEILLELNCHSIKSYQKRISCALPDGDNPSSIQIVLDESLGVFMNTRHDFPNKADIFTLVGYLNNLDFSESLSWVASFLNVEISRTKVIKNHISDILSPFFDSEIPLDDDDLNVILPEESISEFIQMSHKLLSDDGILPIVQSYFGICYDIRDSRILIPIRDIEGNLISIKGRTTIHNYKELKIPKYLSYYSYHGASVLYGYHENIDEILRKKEVIIVEAEKGVMQAFSMGYTNCLALSKSKISEEQISLILNLKCDIVFALDNDISYEDVLSEAKNFIGITNVYIIKDDMNVLEEKDSPFDKGLNIWNILYSKKTRIENV